MCTHQSADTCQISLESSSCHFDHELVAQNLSHIPARYLHTWEGLKPESISHLSNTFKLENASNTPPFHLSLLQVFLWAFFVTKYKRVLSQLCASVLTDIMVGAVAVHVVPEVVAELCNQCYSRWWWWGGLWSCPKKGGVWKDEPRKGWSFVRLTIGKKGSWYSLRARQFSLWPKLFGSPSCQSNLPQI